MTKLTASFPVSNVKALIDQISITFHVDIRYTPIEHNDKPYIRCKFCRQKSDYVLQLGGDKVLVHTEQCRLVRCPDCLRLLVIGKDCIAVE